MSPFVLIVFPFVAGRFLLFTLSHVLAGSELSPDHNYWKINAIRFGWAKPLIFEAYKVA